MYADSFQQTALHLCCAHFSVGLGFENYPAFETRLRTVVRLQNNKPSIKHVLVLGCWVHKLESKLNFSNLFPKHSLTDSAQRSRNRDVTIIIN